MTFLDDLERRKAEILERERSEEIKRQKESVESFVRSLSRLLPDGIRIVNSNFAVLDRGDSIVQGPVVRIELGPDAQLDLALFSNYISIYPVEYGPGRSKYSPRTEFVIGTSINSIPHIPIIVNARNYEDYMGGEHQAMEEGLIRAYEDSVELKASRELRRRTNLAIQEAKARRSLWRRFWDWWDARITT